MKEYVIFPQRMFDAPDRMIGWLEKSVAYTKSLQDALKQAGL
jgi:hypothetical protein